MSNSQFLSRLKLIYEILKKSPCDIKKLQNVLTENNILINKRQIYRDIKSVEKFFLNENELMEEAELNEKKRAWKINYNKDNKSLGINEFYSKLIFYNVVPSYIDKDCKILLQNDIIEDINLKKNHVLFKSIESINAFVNTNFFEKYYCAETEKIFKDIFWCVNNQRKILIKNLPFKTYCQNLENSDFVFSPISFIIHRGSIYIAGTSKKDKVFIFDLAELKGYDYLNTAFKKRDYLLSHVEIELNKRFGICENHDENNYDIVIELSKETGEQLKKYNWHHSQKFKLTPAGYLFNLNCGINNELLEWILMLNTNAKIIKPEKLKQVYCRYLLDLKKMYF
jgi:hypothetical protein